MLTMFSQFGPAVMDHRAGRGKNKQEGVRILKGLRIYLYIGERRVVDDHVSIALQARTNLLD